MPAMETWRQILQDSITTYDQLKKHIGEINPQIKEVISQYPMRINPYYLQLIKAPNDPLWLQAIPSAKELTDSVCQLDPLNEEQLSKVPNLVHKYPDRVLLLVANSCAMYCRFCTRKRKVGTSRLTVSEETLAQAYNYLRENPQIHDVLISGGDPLLLDDNILAEILYQLRSIPSIKIIRIGTRVVSTLPMRITESLVSLLKEFHPLYINTHFNHPTELTPEARKACAMLADAGIPLGCQTVLLKGVNDSAQVLKTLFTELLTMRVKPYYLFQADLTKGTDHLRTHSTKGIKIMRDLYGHISGMALPTLALDAPFGKGKIPLTPQFIIESDPSQLNFNNYLGEVCTYPEAGDAI